MVLATLRTIPANHDRVLQVCHREQVLFMPIVGPFLVRLERLDDAREAGGNGFGDQVAMQFENVHRHGRCGNRRHDQRVPVNGARYHLRVPFSFES